MTSAQQKEKARREFSRRMMRERVLKVRGEGETERAVASRPIIGRGAGWFAEMRRAANSESHRRFPDGPALKQIIRLRERSMGRNPYPETQ